MKKIQTLVTYNLNLFPIEITCFQVPLIKMYGQ